MLMFAGYAIIGVRWSFLFVHSCMDFMITPSRSFWACCSRQSPRSCSRPTGCSTATEMEKPRNSTTSRHDRLAHFWYGANICAASSLASRLAFRIFPQLVDLLNGVAVMLACLAIGLIAARCSQP